MKQKFSQFETYQRAIQAINLQVLVNHTGQGMLSSVDQLHHYGLGRKYFLKIATGTKSDQQNYSELYFDQFCHNKQGEDACSQSEKAILANLIELLPEQPKEEKQQDLPPLRQTKYSESQKVLTKVENNFQIYLEKWEEYSLVAFKSPHLTTPTRHNLSTSRWLFSWVYRPHPFSDIENIFEDSPSYWQADGKQFCMLTVKSFISIKPQAFLIDSALEETVKFQIWGVSLTFQRDEVQTTKLGLFTIKPGPNSIECLKESCNRLYDMILIRAIRMKVRRLRIYHQLPDQKN